MTKKTKEERRAAAMKAELQRTVDRLYAISAAFLRAETVFEEFRNELPALFNAGKSADELVGAIPERIASLEKDPLIRSGSLMMVHLGLLYAVIEAWKNWDFDHPAVDELLKNSFVKELKAYRNAVFHVTGPTDPRILQWTAEAGRPEWTKQLLAAFRVAILAWHSDLASRATVRLARRPV